MTYDTKTPIREDLLRRIEPLIDRLKGQLVVLHYDVQLQTWPATNPQPHLVNTWCFVIITRGALLGDANHLSYVWSFGTDPQVPNDTALEEAVRQVFQRLGMMKLRQMQVGTQDGPNSN